LNRQIRGRGEKLWSPRQTTSDHVDRVDVLPFTGFQGGALAVVAFAALALGGLTMLSARKDEPDES
jgi:hypothetical protein